mgnify:CR=1 FL=1
MRVEAALQTSPTLHLNKLLSARVRAGRISLPVQGPFGYTRLKHIQGVPAGGDGAGFSVQRLQVIDSLIDRIVRVNPEGAPRSRSYESLAAELHRAIQESGSHNAGLGVSEVGSFLSMLV